MLEPNVVDPQGVKEITTAIHDSGDKIANAVETSNHSVADKIVQTEEDRFRRQRTFMVASLVINLLLLIILACFSLAFFSYAIVLTTR
jgi:uncharacterized membrane protein YvbJ